MYARWLNNHICYYWCMQFCTDVKTHGDAEIDIYMKMYLKFYAQLVKVLPMNDAYFMADLTQYFFATGNLKATIEAHATEADKATCFLDNAIKRSLESGDITPFQKLLEIMNSGYVKNVGRDIEEEVKGKLLSITVYYRS